MKSLVAALMTVTFSLSKGYTLKTPSLTRRDFAGLISSSAIIATQQPVQAFDGSGSSAYAGKTATSKAQLRKSYQVRVAADVRDFNRLGAAIARGETNSDEWKFFFIPFPRNSPDAAGRTYAALADFAGVPITENSKILEGGDGYLLAATFTKTGKPPDNTPAVKTYNALAKTFDPIKEAGKSGDAKKAKVAWEKASVLFAKYLGEVEMPDSLSDPLYN